MVEAVEDLVAAVEVLVDLVIIALVAALITAQGSMTMVHHQTAMATPLLQLLGSMTMVHHQTAMAIPQLLLLVPHLLTATELLQHQVAELSQGKNVIPSKTKFPDRNVAQFQGKNVTPFLTRSAKVFHLNNVTKSQ